MKCLDKFNKKMNRNGGSLRSENLNNSIMLLKETFYDDASLQVDNITKEPFIYKWKLNITDYSNEVPIYMRMYERRFSAANGNTVKFQTLYDTPIVVGDVIYNFKSEEYYICTESFDIDSIHWQGKFTKCNWELKWQNPKNGEILVYPCYDINATQYNSGEQSNKQFTIGSSQHMITLPYDENTVALNTPQRFYLDRNKINPTSFIVTQNDTTSYAYGKKGLVKVTVFQTESNPETDRLDLGICDYFEPNSIKTDNADEHKLSKAVISYDSNVIKSGGDTKTFIGKFYDEIGNEIFDIIPQWEIVCDFTNYLEVSKSENMISISIDNDDYIDEEFKLILSDESNSYFSTLLIQIESLF